MRTPGRVVARFFRMVARRPARVVGTTVIGAIIFGFGFNALVLQVGPHPAPLFPKEVPLPPAAALPAPPQRPGAAETTTAAVVPVPPADPIASLIRQAPALEPVREVLFVQRALLKLGYGPLRPDGVFGPGTRQAIEKWERDHKLAPRGEISRRLVQDLAAASGLSPE